MASLETRDFILRLSVDTSPTNPLKEFDGQWTLYDWSYRSGSDRRTDYFSYSEKHGQYLPTTPALLFKMRAGLAFSLVRSGDNWYVQGHILEGDDGLLIWEHPAAEMGAKTYEERAKDAQSCLDEYNKWANGEVYGYELTAREGYPITTFSDNRSTWASTSDSCWGFIGSDYFLEMLRDELLPSYAADYPMRVLVTGDAKDLTEHGKGLDDIPNVEIVTRFTDDGDDEQIDEY